MKLLIFIFVLLLCCSMVLGATGDIIVDSFKIYEDDKLIEGDWDDERIYVSSGKEIDVQIRFKNPYNTTVDVYAWGTLFDIDAEDIELDDNVDISEDDRETIVFTYFIPADTRAGAYDYLVEFEYDAAVWTNVSTLHSYRHERIFEFYIEREEADMTEILLNITKQMAESNEENSDLLATIINMTKESQKLTVCESQLGGLIERNKSLSDYQDKYYVEFNKSMDYMEKYTVCKGQKEAMFSSSQVEDKERKAADEARAQQKKESENTTMLLIGAGVIIFIWQRKKKKVGGEGEGKPLTGSWQ